MSAAAGMGGRLRSAPAKLPGWRVTLLTLFLVALFGGLAARALYLQGFQTGFLQQKGNSFSKKELVVPAHRGRIIDRNGEALALSTPLFQVFVTPRGMQPTPAQFTALAELLEMKESALRKTLDDAEGEFLTLKRVLPARAEKI